MIPRDKPVLCLIGKVQQDPKIFGEDAEEFRLERMMDGNFEKLPKNAWKVRILRPSCSPIRDD